MSHDYNIFTKQELVEFLKKHESNFRFISTPYEIILDQKMNAVVEKIDKNIKFSQELSNEYEKTKNGVKYLIESRKNYEAWSRLQKEHERLEKLRFPREVKSNE